VGGVRTPRLHHRENIMAKVAKKKAAARAKIDRNTLYSPPEAVQLLKETAYAGFNESIEVHARLGIDPRQADQAVRSTVTLPHGTGKSVTVLVFAEGEADRIATDAGADYVGSDDLIKRISDGWVEFDAAIATADMMGKVGGLGRVLGRRGLMPNPRSGTVVRNIEDLPGVISDLKGGRVEFRNDRLGIIHSVIGKKDFTAEQIQENFLSFVDALMRSKPSGIKGIYLRSLALTSTMGPGIRVNIAEAVANAAESAK
jgi:large subunit ribosomal protein L1